MIEFEFEKVPNGLDGVSGVPVLRQRQLGRRGHAVPALEEQVVEEQQEEQEEDGTQVRRQEDQRQGRVSRCSHHLIILPRLFERMH